MATETVPPVEYEPARDPAAVVLAAGRGWTDWLPGNGTAYRVRILPIEGGPDHADRILLINCVGDTVAVQYADPKIAAYRARRWTRTRWQEEGMPKPRGYDWWPVARPLLAAVRMAR